MSEFQFTHTDTVDDVHTYDVVSDTLTAAKRDATAWLSATYGAVRLVGRRGEYVVTATHGRQTFGTVTVERIEDKAPAGPVCAACNGDATCVASDAHHGVVSFGPAPVVYTVAYNDERGNSAERTFTNRADAVILFHETAGIDYAGFPADDVDAFEHQGWLTETLELRGVTHIAEYTPERGNWNVTLYITVEHAPMTLDHLANVIERAQVEDIPAPTFPWPTGPADGDYTGGRPLPELGDVVMTHRWRGGVRDVEASPATVVAPNTEDSRIVRFADGKEQGAFGYDMEPTGARVVEANGRTFDVVPCGRREWTITERGGNGASGLITDQGPRFTYEVDLSGVEGWANNGLASAVREFAAETRMVYATRAQRNVAADYASPGAIGRVLAELATTGTARLDLLSDDVRRTIGSLAMPERPAAAVELHAILTDVR